MKKLLYVSILVLLASCAGKPSDEEMLSGFYKAVLGETEMTDELLRACLSQPVLDALWEADYEDTYSFWNFRTGCQDGPSSESSLESIEPLGEGWYRVSYSDMGIHGITEVKVADGKIVDYRPFFVPFDLAKGYFLRNDVGTDACPVKITSEEELLKYFGMATVMGEAGKPTAIDFDHSFVVPIVYPQTDRETTIVVDSFQHTAPAELTLSASTVRGEEPRSFTIRPIELLVVDSYYRDFDIKTAFSD